MNNTENIDDLLQLKAQMSVLKTQLQQSEIINDDQITHITKEYRKKNPHLKTVIAIIFVLGLSCNIISRIAVNHDQMALWEIILCIVAIISYGALYIPLCAGRNYWIKDGQLYIGHVAPFNFYNSKSITPISKIRFVEIISGKYNNGGRLRIMYNKYDDIYVDPKNITEFIGDLIRENPEIEIRREK